MQPHCSGLVRSAITAVQDDHKDFSIASPKITNAKSLADELIKKVVESEENIDADINLEINYMPLSMLSGHDSLPQATYMLCNSSALCVPIIIV